MSSAQAMSMNLEMLRERLRQQELIIADANELYRAKVREQHELLEKLVERDSEVQSLKMTITDLSEQIGALKVEIERRTNEFTTSLELLMEEKIVCQNELIQVVAGKEKELKEVRDRLREAVADARKREGALESSLAASEQQKGSVEQQLLRCQGTVVDREKTIEGLRREVAELKEALQQARGELRLRNAAPSPLRAEHWQRTREIVSLQRNTVPFDEARARVAATAAEKSPTKPLPRVLGGAPPADGLADPRAKTKSSAVRRIAERIQRLFHPTEHHPVAEPPLLPARENVPNMPPARGLAPLRAPSLPERSLPASITDDMLEEDTQILARPALGGGRSAREPAAVAGR